MLRGYNKKTKGNKGVIQLTLLHNFLCACFSKRTLLAILHEIKSKRCKCQKADDCKSKGEPPINPTLVKRFCLVLDSSWKIISQIYLTKYGNNLFSCNYDYIQLLRRKLSKKLSLDNSLQFAFQSVSNFMSCLRGKKLKMAHQLTQISHKK